MALDKFERQLRLMLLLTSNRKYTIEDLTEKLEMSWRTIYRYLQLFREFGFVVTCRDGCYSLDKSSPYFRQISDYISFSEEEAMTMKRVLQGIGHKSPEVIYLLQKLSHIYDVGALEIMHEDELFARNYQLLYQAIKEGRQVLLKGYSSGHSRQTTDRLVEPYAFISNNSQIRCFEIESEMNKTFNISRVQQVEILPTLWKFMNKHRMLYTDCFHFSGEEVIQIELKLSRLACHLLREEFIVRPETLQQLDEEHWIYKDGVCSYVGVGRFILGLPGEIEVIGDEGLKTYLHERVRQYSEDISF